MLYVIHCTWKFHILAVVCAHYIFAMCIVMVTSFLNFLVIMGHLTSHRVLVKPGELRGEATVSWGEVTGETSRCLWKSFDHPISMTLSFCWDGYLWTRYLLQSMKLAGSALGMVRTTLKNPTCLHVWKYGGSTSCMLPKNPEKKTMRRVVAV